MNLTMNVTIWDRICKAGDLTIHTAEDKEPDMVLRYVKHPEKLETMINNMNEIDKIITK